MSSDSSQQDAYLLRRRAARLMAVQALYASDFSLSQGRPAAGDPAALIEEVMELGMELDEEDAGENTGTLQPDKRFLKQLVSGVLLRQEEIDALIIQHLQEGWQISRLGFLKRALLRSAVFELLELKKVPPLVTINEYVTIGRTFLDGADTRFINAILDNIARQVRSDSFSP